MCIAKPVSAEEDRITETARKWGKELFFHREQQEGRQGSPCPGWGSTHSDSGLPHLSIKDLGHNQRSMTSRLQRSFWMLNFACLGEITASHRFPSGASGKGHDWSNLACMHTPIPRGVCNPKYVRNQQMRWASEWADNGPPCLKFHDFLNTECNFSSWFCYWEGVCAAHPNTVNLDSVFSVDHTSPWFRSQNYI